LHWKTFLFIEANAITGQLESTLFIVNKLLPAKVNQMRHACQVIVTALHANQRPRMLPVLLTVTQ